MVGGPLLNGQQDYKDFPFNLATEGHRQPGSAFKPFTLAVALHRAGTAPTRSSTRRRRTSSCPTAGARSTSSSTTSATRTPGRSPSPRPRPSPTTRCSPRSGSASGPAGSRGWPSRWGSGRPISNNYAMILGGLKEGVTPLDMAHAYETLATGGMRVYNPRLGAPDEGPTGIAADQLSGPRVRKLGQGLCR